MKKNNVKAFTLVEMLIVIVIIGILIASLMPRMQSAQGRARDVARKNDLAQIQTAIITSQQDRGAYPGMEGNLAKDKDNNVAATGAAASGMMIKDMSDNLLKAGMSSIPTDPNGSNDTWGLGDFNAANTASGGQYLYLVAKRNGVANAGVVLMAKTEVEGSSNWVVCTGADNNGKITNDTDLADIQLCTQVTEGTECSNSEGTCTYKESGELRYILLY